MRCSTIALAMLAPAVIAVPNPFRGSDISYIDGGIKSDKDDRLHDKRELIYTDGGINNSSVEHASAKLATRNSDYISSCGKNWISVEDRGPEGNRDRGYRSAVEKFCFHQTHTLKSGALILGPGQYSSGQISGRLKLSHGNIPAVINFEIHNKLSDGTHTVVENDCKTYLMKMADQGRPCYGRANYDTKGGTWQIGNDDVSYNGLPEKSTA